MSRAADLESVWHGPMRLPKGVRAMVDRCDQGRVLLNVEYAPDHTENDLEEIEDFFVAVIARRRRALRTRAEAEGCSS